MITPIEQYVIDAVRKKRRAQKITQAMLGEFIEVSRGFIARIESPKCDDKYNLNHLNEIAKFLGCSPRDFLPEKPL